MSTPIILVVEDRQAEQYVLQHLLKKFNYDVQVMSTGESAVDALKMGSFSAILMDLTLPGISGIECAKQIREIEKESEAAKTPIIAVTAKAEKADKDACMAVGMDDYLVKPFTPEQLRAILNRFVSEPSLN
jgi:two-component system sensor histidine kinase/response regulator